MQECIASALILCSLIDWTVEILGLYDLALHGIKITDDESSNRWYLEETIKKKEEQVNE